MNNGPGVGKEGVFYLLAQCAFVFRVPLLGVAFAVMRSSVLFLCAINDRKDWNGRVKKGQLNTGVMNINVTCSDLHMSPRIEACWKLNFS